MKLAMGVFDGVHRGHQKVIEKAHRVVTFDPHPNLGTHLLTTIEERQDLIGNLDVIHFNQKLTCMSPRDFIEQVIVRKYKPNLEAIIVGHDFVFGYNREGNVETLRKLGQEFGFSVEEIPEFILDQHPVRSSTLRKLLAKGEIETVNNYLGRDYQLNGTIVHGKGRGTGLGFPTINIKPDHPEKLIPLEGVYSGEVILNKKIWKGAIFIGERQTFGEHTRVIEVHVLGLAEQVYGQKCTVFFQKYLRGEEKFSSPEALKQQIQKDITQLN